MWQPAMGRMPAALMAARSIEAVGQSGRLEALAWLTRLKSQPLETPVPSKSLIGDFEPALVSAAFALHYNQQYGQAAYRHFFLTEGDDLKEYLTWRNDDAGRPWAEWLNERYKARGLGEVPIPFPAPQ